LPSLRSSSFAFRGAAGTAVAVAGLAAVSGAQKTRRARRSAPVMVGCSMEDQWLGWGWIG